MVGTTFSATDPVVVAKVDADAHRELATRFGVSAYPTLKWFPAGSATPEDYSGGRTAPDLVTYINGMTGLARRVKKEPTAVAELDDTNFDAVVMNPDADVLVEFFAPVRDVACPLAGRARRAGPGPKRRALSSARRCYHDAPPRAA